MNLSPHSLRAFHSCIDLACCAALVMAGSTLSTAHAADEIGEPHMGPWDITALRAAATDCQWAGEDGPVRGLYYEGEPYHGKPTRVFAYIATPDGASTSDETFPAMVLAHGGGGTADAEWAALWAQRGYVALAMDLTGKGPDGQPLDDGGPNDGGFEKFAAIRGDIKDVWSYHAVANVLRAVGVVAAMPQVDPQRIGITGISWGGYLTCIVAGLDDRVRVAVPVYGCGFLHENSAWLGEFELLGQDPARAWVENFDPSRYLPQARIPMLFVTGAKDPAYPLDSYQKSYRMVPGGVTLCIRPQMTHGHSAGWEPAEIGLFVDSVLKPAAAPLPRMTRCERDGSTITLHAQGPRPIVQAQLHYTTDTGPWPDRAWHSLPMANHNDIWRGTLPQVRPLVYFVNATDERGATVSTPHDQVTTPSSPKTFP